MTFELNTKRFYMVNGSLGFEGLLPTIYEANVTFWKNLDFWKFD